MKAEQDSRINMSDNLDDLQNDFEKAAKDRIEELKHQTDRDSDTLKDEVKDLKDEADNSYKNYKSELNDFDDPYKDEKIAVEDESMKVVKKEIDADYEDSIDNLNSEKDHRIDSIERLMDEDMNKDYDKGVDAIYLNESEDKFQHQKDHYANRKASDYDKIKASYDDIQEANTADRIEDFTTGKEYKGHACEAPHTKKEIKKDNLKNKISDYSKNNKVSSDELEDYKEMYGDHTCKSGVENNNLDVNNNTQQDAIASTDIPDNITEEYFVVITDNYVDDDNYTYDCGCGSVPVNESSENQKPKQSNQYEEQANKSYSGNSQEIYSGKKQSDYSNNIRNQSSQNVKDNTCSYDLKQDILDEADRVMGDDML